MTQKEADKLKHGLYKLFWKSGGFSLAAVGSLHNGKHWYAATNWTAYTAPGITSTDWRSVEHVEEIPTEDTAELLGAEIRRLGLLGD